MLEFCLRYVSLAIGALLLSRENSRTSLPFWGTESTLLLWLEVARGGFVM